MFTLGAALRFGYCILHFDSRCHRCCSDSLLQEVVSLSFAYVDRRQHVSGVAEAPPLFHVQHLHSPASAKKADLQSTNRYETVKYGLAVLIIPEAVLRFASRRFAPSFFES